MQETTIYKVGNKKFLSKEEALEYEDTLKKDLKLRARNLFLFWNKMLGYPGIVTATQLVNNFAGNRKFTFGQYKGNGIGDIIFTDRQYVEWCLNNIPSFKLNEREQVLFDTDTHYTICGSSTVFNRGGYIETYHYDGDTYDSNLINLEKDWMK